VRRLDLLTFVFALILVGCASESAGPTPTTESGQASTTQPSESPDSTEAPAATTTTEPGATETTSGRPSAPDFSLELGEGGTYTLSEGAKPVYLVFWAEW
jgi:PBP1b-binding outer membrane lipoprotein LpoB